MPHAAIHPFNLTLILLFPRSTLSPAFPLLLFRRARGGWGHSFPICIAVRDENCTVNLSKLMAIKQNIQSQHFCLPENEAFAFF